MVSSYMQRIKPAFLVKKYLFLNSVKNFRLSGYFACDDGGFEWGESETPQIATYHPLVFSPALAGFSAVGGFSIKKRIRRSSIEPRRIF